MEDFQVYIKYISRSINESSSSISHWQKDILAPLVITAAVSAIDARIQKKIHISGTAALIILNEEMNDVLKIVQALYDSNILLKGISKTIENETKE